MRFRQWRPSTRSLVSMLAVAVGVVAAPALAGQAADPPQQEVFLYVDSVNGTRPVGVKPRPIGCTQTNYFQRGEQVVFRVWGTEAATGDILSTENVRYAYVKIPGQPNLKLNWGAHGAQSNRVLFWTAAWVVPKSYPLGVAPTRIVFKTESNRFGRYDYDVTVVPSPSSYSR